MNRATRRRLNRAYAILAKEESLTVNNTKVKYRKLRKESPIYVGINSIKHQTNSQKAR